MTWKVIHAENVIIPLGYCSKKKQKTNNNRTLTISEDWTDCRAHGLTDRYTFICLDFLGAQLDIPRLCMFWTWVWAVVIMSSQGSPVKSYDYLLKFLLVGDSDVGKGEILDSLQDGSAESPYAYSSGESLRFCVERKRIGSSFTRVKLLCLCLCPGIDYKTTTILLDGRRVKLELWYEHIHSQTKNTASLWMHFRFFRGFLWTCRKPEACVLFHLFLFVFRDTSGQGRFCTIFRSYSRGAQVRPTAGSVTVVM